MEAVREYAASEGDEVLEEIKDPVYSGASLKRPGMERIRDLVTAGRASVVLAQDRERFAREPAYHYLLEKAFEEQGTKLRPQNNREATPLEIVSWQHPGRLGRVRVGEVTGTTTSPGTRRRDPPSRARSRSCVMNLGSRVTSTTRRRGSRPSTPAYAPSRLKTSISSNRSTPRRTPTPPGRPKSCGIITRSKRMGWRGTSCCRRSLLPSCCSFPCLGSF